AQPLNHRSAHEHAAFECVMCVMADFPGYGCEQAMSGRDGASACALQHKAARAVGILGEAGADASLPKECSLLVAGNACDRNAIEAWNRAYLSINFTGGPDCRQHRGGDSEQIEQIAIPAAGM